jgi:hypothetical protein
VKVIAYVLSLVLTNIVAVVASTFILRFKPISWLLQNYFWPEIAINFFAFLVAAYAGLQVAQFVCAKVAKSQVGRLAAWVLIVPFALLGVAEVFVRNNVMGLVGAAGALAGAGMFNKIARDENELEERRRSEAEGSY